MSENETTILNSTDMNERYYWYQPITVHTIIQWIVEVLTLAAFMYGVTSWCLIRKFRNFINYILISAIFANVLRFTVFEFSDFIIWEIQPIDIGLFVFTCLIFYCVQVNFCWLLVMCYIFYVDIVKVFQGDIRHRYLKSSLFAWGAPLIAFSLFFIGFLLDFMFSPKESSNFHLAYTVSYVILLLPVLINLIIYIIVLYSLFGCSNANMISATNKWRRIYIATLIFVLSNVIALSVFIEFIFKVSNIFDIILRKLIEYLNTIILVMYLPLIRSNRKLWREYFKKRQSSLEMSRSCDISSAV